MDTKGRIFDFTPTEIILITLKFLEESEPKCRGSRDQGRGRGSSWFIVLCSPVWNSFTSTGRGGGNDEF